MSDLERLVALMLAVKNGRFFIIAMKRWEHRTCCKLLGVKRRTISRVNRRKGLRVRGLADAIFKYANDGIIESLQFIVGEKKNCFFEFCMKECRRIMLDKSRKYVSFAIPLFKYCKRLTTP